MTEQHLLDNGYKKYAKTLTYEMAFFQKKVNGPHGYNYYIDVSHCVWPDGWESFTPKVQFDVLAGSNTQTVNLEAVQWYNTYPSRDTSSHDIKDAEEFFARAVEALGLREEE